jgi:hypothetical protein
LIGDDIVMHALNNAYSTHEQHAYVQMWSVVEAETEPCIWWSRDVCLLDVCGWIIQVGMAFAKNDQVLAADTSQHQIYF